MTREEALRELMDIRDEATAYPDAVCYVTSEDEDALNMAIEALNADANEIYNYLKERIGDIVDDMKEFDAWFERMAWHVKECNRLTAEPKTGECETCKRNADNGGFYDDGRTRCPIQEHYALLKDGYCHLYEPRMRGEEE